MLPPNGKSFVLGRFRPTPGQKKGDMEIPGAGLYEADFSVPGWLLPEYSSESEKTVTFGDKKITHLASALEGDLWSIRFRVRNAEPDEPVDYDPEDPYSGINNPAEAGIPVSSLVRVIGPIALAGVGAVLIRTLGNSVKEVRKLFELPGGRGLAGGSALLLGGVGVALAVRSVKG